MRAVVDVMVMVRVEREGHPALEVPTTVQVEGEVQVLSIDRVIQTDFVTGEDGEKKGFIDRDMKPFLTKEELARAYEEFNRGIERSLPNRPGKLLRGLSREVEAR